MQPTQQAADRAYQAHHAACAQCRAAGASPNYPRQAWQPNRAGERIVDTRHYAF